MLLIIQGNILNETQFNSQDLNLACDIMFYGRVFRIVDADNWTKASLMGHREITSFGFLFHYFE